MPRGRITADRGFRTVAHQQYAGLLDGADHARRTGPGPHGPDCRAHLRRVERHEARHEPFADRALGELDFDGIGLPGDGFGRARHSAQDPAHGTAGEVPAKGSGRRAVVEKALTDSFLCARRVALTQREGQLVSLLSQGLKNKEIATTLMISEGTVKVYLSRLFQKVGVKDRFELALFGLKNLTTGQLPVGEKGHRSAMPGLRSLVLERPAERAEAPVRFPIPLRPVASRHY